MRYALFSDIHSNLEAFRAVREALKKESIDRFICIGDIVGYGADPGECIRQVRELKADVVAGNHDYAAVGKTSIARFNSYAQEAALWTRAQLNPSERDFLAGLELIKEYPDFAIVHAALDEPEKWHYILRTPDAQNNFHLLNKRILFIGHSHVPSVFEETMGNNAEPQCRPFFKEQINLKAGSRYIINVGSVGQPRDGDPRASFAIYDTEREEVQIRRVNYDVAIASDKILKAGLPEKLAYRIIQGK